MPRSETGPRKTIDKKSANANQAEVLKTAHAHPNVRAHLDGKKLIKEIYVPGKIVNLVIGG